MYNKKYPQITQIKNYEPTFTNFYHLMYSFMEKEITIWDDQEADYLEVLFERKPGYFKETDNNAVMKKVDRQGNVVGFSVLNISVLKKQEPLSVSLKSYAA